MSIIIGYCTEASKMLQHTVFPRIEARASISFSRVLYPASIWGRPQIGAGLYLFLYSGNLPYVLIDSAFYRRRVMAASQVVPRGVYEKESVVRGHHIYKTVWTPVIGEELPVEREEDNQHDQHAVAVVKNGYVLASTILEYVA